MTSCTTVLFIVCVQPSTLCTCICTHSHPHTHPCVSRVPAEINDISEQQGYRQELSREQREGQSVLVTFLTTGTANLTKAARFILTHYWRGQSITVGRTWHQGLDKVDHIASEERSRWMLILIVFYFYSVWDTSACRIVVPTLRGSLPTPINQIQIIPCIALKGWAALKN